MKSAEEMAARVGCRVDDALGTRLGRLAAVYVDRESGGVVWLEVALAETGDHLTALPPEGAVVGAGRVWVPVDRRHAGTAPRLIGGRPLGPRVEQALCAHFGRVATRGAAAASWERRSAVARCEGPVHVRSTAWRSGRAEAGRELRQVGLPAFAGPAHSRPPAGRRPAAEGLRRAV